MTISTRFLVIFTIMMLLLGGIVSALSLLASSNHKAAQAEFLRFESRKLAEQLRQSSDDLTRMARTYVVTGDPVYESYFHDILAIRAGQQDRPAGYDSIYWDFVTATHTKPGPNGDPKALIQMMIEAGFTSKELAMLELSIQNSNTLAELEKIAFGAMKGRFQDEDGLLTTQGQPDQSYASQLLHSAEYHQAKAAIMGPIAQFFAMVDERTLKELLAHRADQNRYRNITALFIGTAVLFVIGGFFNLRTRLVKPVIELSNIAEQIKAGQPHDIARHQSNDEVGNLARVFNAMTDRVERTMRNLEQLSSIDGLTGVSNRRIFDEAVVTEWKRCERSQVPLSIIMIDIDFFKSYNDAFGHLAGDDCLKAVAEILSHRPLRPGDVLARYGGEEFAFLLSNMSADNAQKFGHAICELVEKAKIQHPRSSISDFVTVSVGVATKTPMREGDVTKLIKSADDALYKAKHGGRNRVVRAGP